MRNCVTRILLCLLLFILVPYTINGNNETDRGLQVIRGSSPFSFVVFDNGDRYIIEDAKIEGFEQKVEVRHQSDQILMSFPLRGRLEAPSGAKVLHFDNFQKMPFESKRLAFVTTSVARFERCCPRPAILPSSSTSADYIVIVDSDIDIDIDTYGIWRVIDASGYLLQESIDKKLAAEFLKLNIDRIPELNDYDIIVWVEGELVDVVQQYDAAERATALVHEGFDISFVHNVERKSLLIAEVYALATQYAHTDKSAAERVINQYAEYLNNDYPEKLICGLDQNTTLDSSELNHIVLFDNGTLFVSSRISDDQLYLSLNNITWYPILYNDNLIFPSRAKWDWPGVWLTDLIIWNMRSRYVPTILENWWLQVQKHRTADSISLPYILFKVGFIPNTLFDQSMRPLPAFKSRSLNETLECISRAQPQPLDEEIVGPLITASSAALSENSCLVLFSNGNDGVQNDTYSIAYSSWVERGYHQKFWSPKTEMPLSLRNSYLMNDKVVSRRLYRYQRQNGGEGYFWSRDEIEARGKEDCTCGDYNTSQCAYAFRKYKHLINEKKGMVIGSQKPWAEAALLSAGAAHVTTVEYMEIRTDHPRLSTIHPFKLHRDYLDGKFEPVDFIFSYSSLEHDGLGRYGDPINPFGDLESIARIHCLLKPGGIFFLSVPMAYDAVVWNAHRIYGNHRLSVILSNWKPIDLINNKLDICDDTTIGFSDNEPLWVLEKN